MARRIGMRALALIMVCFLAACGDAQPTTSGDSGVEGVVHLGPQCPVEVAGQPCDDQPAGGVAVTVSLQVAGEMYGAGDPVAQTTTDALGRFRIAVPPGDYVVTAEAGMYCEFMDAHVVADEYVEVDVPCDTGIR
ncbi:MAG TPA: carboxypeptidase-like regulatory domain-containing protein [Nocardioidaceae bacterium]|nr:carboxypeptidase-like regulatory domain-containing protein [Nocardioidaceae bacterium]